MIKNFGQQVCSFLKRLTLPQILMGAGIGAFFTFFFYRDIRAFPFMLPIGLLFMEGQRRKKEREAQLFFLEQFKECILSVSASLKAGYAVENAFLESMGDMKLMFGENSSIAEELRRLQKGLRNNETLEALLFSLARRKELEEIGEFAEVFAIAKRNSGNVTETIEVYSRSIVRKMEIREEIETLLAAKRLEQRVMNIMPFGVVLYLEYSSPGYFDVLFHNRTGAAIMTGCLVCYLGAYWLSQRIFEKAFG